MYFLPKKHLQKEGVGMSNCMITRKGGGGSEIIATKYVTFGNSQGTTLKATTEKDYKRVYVILNGQNGGSWETTTTPSIEAVKISSGYNDTWGQIFSWYHYYYENVPKGTVFDVGRTGHQGSIILIGIL